MAQADPVNGRVSMRDFTLVIPTYNRPRCLAALLSYLEEQAAEFRVLVLDSSRPEPRALNKKRMSSSKLSSEWIEFPEETHPFDKFREGIGQVTTQFCALCADDDLVLVDGIRRSLDALRANAKASVAQGYSFSFLSQPDGMYLNDILYFTPTIADGSPLARLGKLFDRYQAATYGNYRTEVLQRIFDRSRPMKSILARELLGSALAVIEGEVIRVPCFSHGRSMDASETYEHWHPLEWAAKDPQGLFREYLSYREIVVKALLDQPDNDHSEDNAAKIVDLIHLNYFVKHAPEKALSFIISQEQAKLPFDSYWANTEIQYPLVEAAGISASVDNAQRRWSGELRALGATLTGDGASPIGVVAGPRNTYRLRSGFVAPARGPVPSSDAIKELLVCLDHYRLGSQSVLTASLPSVSVLLCNRDGSVNLASSLQEICDQSVPPNEILVVDDGSTDNSVAIIEDFARRYSFIRVLKNDGVRGALYSINRALGVAKSDFIVWAAAGDRLLPNFLERSLTVLRQYPRADIVVSRPAPFADGPEKIHLSTYHCGGTGLDFGDAAQFLSPAALCERLKKGCLCLPGDTVIARRKCLLQWGGFDSNLDWLAGYFAFWVTALRQGVCLIPETLVAARRRPDAYSSSSASLYNRHRVAILGLLLDKMTLKGWRDIGVVALHAPSLFSPFGTSMLSAAWRKPRRWPFFLSYALWLAADRVASHDQNKPWCRLLAVTLRSAETLVQYCMSQAEKLLRYARKRLGRG
jgi:glycosyltransferase domain-containing protein